MFPDGLRPRLSPSLSGAVMPSDPFALFDQWFAEARASEPNDRRSDGARDRRRGWAAVGADGPAQGPRRRGFHLLHQPRQPKGRRARRESPTRPCCFTGSRFAAQVRVEGPVEPVPADEADAYYREPSRGIRRSGRGRPTSRGHSTARETFEARFDELAARFDGGPVPRPPHWAGFRVKPRQIEFWTDGAHRLHERRSVHLA